MALIQPLPHKLVSHLDVALQQTMCGDSDKSTIMTAGQAQQAK
jgi:hypothetical protein